MVNENLIIAVILAFVVGIFALYRHRLSPWLQLGIALICTVYLSIEIILQQKPEGWFSILLGLVWIAQSIRQIRGSSQH